MSHSAIHPSSEGVVPWPAELADQYVRKGYWQGKPLSAHLFAQADRTPDSVALVDGETRLTYRQLMERADGLAIRLLETGLRPDDRIVLQLPNCWEFVVLTLACLRLGVLPVMALPAHRRQEVTYLAEHAEARALAVSDVFKGFDHQEMAQGVRDEIATVEHVLVAGDDIRTGSVDLRALCEPVDGARAQLDRLAPDSRSTAVFLLSGGTTGLPKLIARTHDDYAYNAKRSGEVCGFDTQTVYLGVLPLGHNFPLACPGIIGTLLVGGRVVVLRSPAPADAFEVIEREGVTVTSVVPAIAQRWLDHCAEDDHDISSLQVLQVGGARLADNVARRVKPTLGCTLQQVFGMAEGLLNYTRLDDADDVICTTQGRPICADDEIVIVDEHGQPVPEGKAGLLLTRGPYTPRGYYRAKEQNARAFTEDGWFRTGDVVSRTPEGNLCVEGRDKDMINRGGEKISAEEVENFLYQLESVSSAAAVAMPDPELGERVCVYVVPREGTSVTLDDIRAVMERAGTARFKLPERLVTVDSLFTTKVGKVDKKALRADLANRMAAELEMDGEGR